MRISIPSWEIHDLFILIHYHRSMETSNDFHMLSSLYSDICAILHSAKTDFQTFISLSKENKTIRKDISYKTLCIWLQDAQTYVHTRTKHPHTLDDISASLQTEDGISKALSLTKLFQLVSKRALNPQKPLISISPNIYQIQEYPSSGNTQKTISRISHGKSLELNGVKAVEVTIKKHANLQDPILDLQLKLNNPIGRLWLAIKRLWKSQHTVISLRFSIPLFVLPIMIFVFWNIWKGQTVSIPMAKIGVVHTISVNGNEKDILILPSDTLYFLEYSSTFSGSVYKEQPVVASGTYNSATNIMRIDTLSPYDSSDEATETQQIAKQQTFLQEILAFLGMFY